MGQLLYVEKLLKKYGMENAKAISTPVDVGNKLVKADTNSEMIDPVLYQSAVGILLYLLTKTCPEYCIRCQQCCSF